MLTRNKPTFILLFLLISFGSIAAVLFTPALPQISNYFHISSNTAQLTITLFLVGYTVGQLLYGPLANGYGRKIALYIGILLEIVSSLLCVLAGSAHMFWLLLLGRLCMALGASVGLKMCFTLVAHSYSEKSTTIISHLMIAFAITPSLGVAIGGFLTQHLNWQSCFYFLALYGMFLLYLVYRMPETAATIDRNALKFSTIYENYVDKLRNKTLIVGGAMMGCSTAFVYVFATLAPFIAMQQMHLNPSQYGLWNLLPPIGILCGSQLSAYLAKKLSTIDAILFGTSIILMGALLILFAFLVHMLQPIWLFLPLIIIYIGMSFVFANASAFAMHKTQDKSTASAMMSFINIGIATLTVLIVGLLPTKSVLVLPLTYLILSLFIFLLYLFANTNQTALCN